MPPRFFLIAALSLAVAASLALAHLRSGRRRALLTAAVFAGLAVDGAISGMPLGRPPGAIDGVAPHSRILALPMDNAPLAVTTLYRSMEPRLLTVNGYAGYVPPHAAIIDWALRRHDASVLTELRRGQPLYVLAGDADDAREWTLFMDAQPEARLIGVTGGGRLYEMSPAPYRAIVHAGPALRPRQVEERDGWLVADLGARREVRALDLWIRRSWARLPEIVRVETSLDGRTWSTAAEEAPGGPALAGALADPLSVPLRLVLDVSTAAARFVRINTPGFDATRLTLYAP